MEIETMPYTMRAEYRVILVEEYERLEDAIGYAQQLQDEHPDGGFAVSGEGIHLTLLPLEVEVAA